MFGSVFILIQFLQVVQGASPLRAAYETTPWTMAPMISGAARRHLRTAELEPER